MVMGDEIILIDKHLDQRDALIHFLTKHAFKISSADSWEDAANKLLTANNFSLAIIRFSPHDTNVLSMLHNIKSFNPTLGIILLSNLENIDLPVNLIKKGTIDQFTSPDNMAGIFSAVKNEFNKRDLIQTNETYRKRLFKLNQAQEKNIRKTRALEEVHESTLEHLMTALDLRDVETFGHSNTVAKYSQVLANILGIRDKSSLSNIKKGALLHDIGKIAIPDSILKKPNALTKKEWEKIKLHPALGFGLIKEIKLMPVIGNIILFHHEKFDGTGYPQSLKKEEIPPEARIFALADALDAITSHRPYRKERSFEYAQTEISANSGSQFDPEVVNAFCSLPPKKWARIRYETTKLLPYMEEMMQVTQ